MNHSATDRPHSDSSPLISADALVHRLGQPGVKLFDVRGRWSPTPAALLDEYLAGHIQGAVFLDWTTKFLTPEVPLGLAPVASRQHAALAFESLGICEGDRVVLYDDSHHMFAARIWWAMRYWGFDRVEILNGGWRHWQAQGLPVSTTEEIPSSGTFAPAVQSHLRASVQDVIERGDEVCLLDGRGRAGYLGRPGDDRSGHIPGAKNIPFRSLVDESTGLFKDDAALAEIFGREAGIGPEATIISSCGSGYAGAVLLVALEQLGITAPLFDDSFAVWKQDPARTVERDLPSGP